MYNILHVKLRNLLLFDVGKKKLTVPVFETIRLERLITTHHPEAAG